MKRFCIIYILVENKATVATGPFAISPISYFETPGAKRLATCLPHFYPCIIFFCRVYFWGNQVEITHENNSFVQFITKH